MEVVGSPYWSTGNHMQRTHTTGQRRARIAAAIAGLIALLILGVTSAAVDTPTPQPWVVPVSSSMSLGGTSTMSTPPTSPEVASASPMVKAPHK
jgi:hypothetical protein